MQMREPRSVDPAFAGKPNLKYPDSSTGGRPTKPQVSPEWYSFKIIHRRNVSSFELHGLYLDFIWTLLLHAFHFGSWKRQRSLVPLFSSKSMSQVSKPIFPTDSDSDSQRGSPTKDTPKVQILS